MPTLKLHYDGWLLLPVGLRQALALNSGDRVMAELVEGTLVLRPATKARRPAPGGGSAVPVGVDASETLGIAADAMPIKRKPGRPRKPSTISGENATPPKNARGRPRKTAIAVEPDAAASQKVVVGPAKLRKKADLEVKTTASEMPEPTSSPAMRIRPDRGTQPVERRPFRNVEVRSLGPGRGHNKRLSSR